MTQYIDQHKFWISFHIEMVVLKEIIYIKEIAEILWIPTDAQIVDSLTKKERKLTKLAKLDDPKAPFSILHQGVGKGATPIPGVLYFTVDTYLIMLSVKQGSIKYHFLSLWYDSIWEEIPVFKIFDCSVSWGCRIH